MARLLTVILNWRSADMTLQAAEAALVALQGIQGALTIVDNDSGDGSFDAMSQAVKDRGWDVGPQQVRVMQSGRNGGFGAGNNVGIRAGLPDGSKPDFVYILNSDAFPKPDAIRALLDHLKMQPKTGFAGSHLYGEDGAAHRTAFRFPSIAGEVEAAARFGPITRLLQNSVIAAPIPDHTGVADWLAGASLMMRQSVLDEIGLFDERFFLYFEETDLSLRAARAGYPSDFVMESHVVHIGGASTGMKEWQRIPQFWLDSRWYYFAKNHGRLYATFATMGHVAAGLLWRARLLVQRKDRGDPPYFLRDLISHSLRSGWQSLFAANPALPARTRPAE